MKITKPRAPRWTDNEILKLRKVYPRGTRDEILAAFPRRSFAAIVKAANGRGVYRAPSPYKPTGNSILDEILAKIRSSHWSRKELDIEAASGGYFYKRRWRNGRYNHRMHYAAIELLGGRLRYRLRGCGNEN